jgi:transposase
MRSSFVGKVASMPNKYDEQTKAKAVRLVTEHVQDYDSDSS